METSTTEAKPLLSFIDSPKTTHVPMTQDQTLLFMRCMAIEGQTNDARFDAKEAAKIDQFPTSVLEKRLTTQPNDGVGTPVTIGAALFVASISKNVGSIVMWAYTLNRVYNKERKQVTLGLLADYFPWGFPNEEEVHRIWEAQKDERHSNRMDDSTNWELDEISEK